VCGVEAARSASSGGGSDDGDGQQTALLVGLLSFVALGVAAITAACHKRCQQRLRRLLGAVAKAPPAAGADISKNNSYKSSPSGRSADLRYSSYCLSACSCVPARVRVAWCRHAHSPTRHDKSTRRLVKLPTVKSTRRQRWSSRRMNDTCFRS